METEQIDKRFTWLDEQRRKDTEQLGRVGERLDGLEQEIRRLAEQIQLLVGDQARTAAVATRALQADEALHQHRTEINDLIEAAEQRRLVRERQLEELRKAGERQTGEALDDLQTQLKATKQFEGALEARRQEELRITRDLDKLGKRIESLARDVKERSQQGASLAEGRRKDGQRIAELESRAMELHKKVEALSGLFDVAQEQARRLQTKAGELEASEGELRQAQTLWAEQQAVRQAEFERVWKAYEKQFNAVAKQAEELDERLGAFEETYRNLKRLEAELSQLVARLERRIEEVSEIQRLSEDRFKQEWAGQQADEHKRWSAFKLESEEHRRDHERLHEKLAAELRTLQEDASEARDLLMELRRTGDQRLQDALSMLREWAAEGRGTETTAP